MYVQGDQCSDRAQEALCFLNMDSVKGTVSRQDGSHLGHESSTHLWEPQRESDSPGSPAGTLGLQLLSPPALVPNWSWSAQLPLQPSTQIKWESKKFPRSL